MNVKILRDYMKSTDTPTFKGLDNYYIRTIDETKPYRIYYPYQGRECVNGYDNEEDLNDFIRLVNNMCLQVKVVRP